MKKRRLILVTGAPRSGTTPVGNLLAKCDGAVSLYEPLGKTGLTRIAVPFPMVGDGLGIEPGQLQRLLDDLAALRLGRLKSQVRRGSSPSLFTRVFGSRTLHSLRLARLQPWSRSVIWKDPHAVLLAPDLVKAGIDVVVTARTPNAHAASYKRLRWHSRAAEVYPRWSSRFGPCTICETYLDQSRDGVVSAALLWRMSYLPLVRTSTLDKVHLITSADLEADERSTYHDLIRDLALAPGRGVEQTLAKPRRDAAPAEMSRKTHDWTRSVASVNSYWREVLSAEDIELVDRITSDLAPHLFPESARRDREQLR